jgi:hypothetical protein
MFLSLFLVPLLCSHLQGVQGLVSLLHGLSHVPEPANEGHAEHTVWGAVQCRRIREERRGDEFMRNANRRKMQLRNSAIDTDDINRTLF